jgi:hypothetical protein
MDRKEGTRNNSIRLSELAKADSSSGRLCSPRLESVMIPELVVLPMPNIVPLERPEISEGFPNFVPEFIVLSSKWIHTQMDLFRGFVAITLSHKVIDVIPNQTNGILVQY